jgi:hypothetical protein
MEFAGLAVEAIPHFLFLHPYMNVAPKPVAGAARPHAVHPANIARDPLETDRQPARVVPLPFAYRA